MNIHIINAGEIGPIDASFENFTEGDDKIDILYIITGEAKIEGLKSKLKHEYKDIVTINPFQLDPTINAIISIYKKEKELNRKCQIYINMTGGTNLMAVAAYLTSMILDIKLYYIPIGLKPIFLGPPTPLKPMLKIKPNILSYMQEINDNKELHTSRSTGGFAKHLSNIGLVEFEYNKEGQKYPRLTPSGSFYLEIYTKSKSHITKLYENI